MEYGAIDLHKRRSQIRIVSEAGAVLLERRIDTTRAALTAVFGDRPLVVTKNVTYTAHNIAEFFEAVGFPEGVRPYVTRVLPAWEALPAPMVPV